MRFEINQENVADAQTWLDLRYWFTKKTLNFIQFDLES